MQYIYTKILSGIVVSKAHGLDKSIQFHCHTVIHEAMHLHSYKGDGANSWLNFSEISHEFDPRQKFDEGFTEMFTRAILHRMRSNPQIRNSLGKELPSIVYQGTRDTLLPVYEGLKDIASEIVRSVGIVAVSEGYFLGKWEKFNQKMLSVEKCKSKQFWKLVCQTSHTSSVFMEQKDITENLTKLGIPVSNPMELHNSVINDTYVDKNSNVVLDLLPRN